jgi:pyruvate/2-oxoglutarate dehydrogenase complex dihydrolipoamide acyltransferase (E2) component
MTTNIIVPDIGDFKDVEVIDVLVKVGDTIAVETPLVTLETEKATMDVPSTLAGVVKRVAIKKGDRVGKGAVVVEVEAGAAQVEKRPSPQPSVTAPGVTLPPASMQSSPTTGEGTRAALRYNLFTATNNAESIHVSHAVSNGRIRGCTFSGANPHALHACNAPSCPARQFGRPTL